MDTLDFLRRVLPQSGYKIFGMAKGDVFRHVVVETLEELQELVDLYDTDPSVKAVYHACAGYLEREVLSQKVRNGETVTVSRSRTRENAGYARSFWVDLDVGEDTKTLKKYPTKRDALAAVLMFSDKVGIPRPLVVDSGGGLHCYWPLVQEVSSEHWVKVAQIFKGVLAHHKVLQDPSRTADIASVLRPVGSHNRKNDAARRVKVVLDQQPIDFAAFARPLIVLSKSLNLKPPKTTASTVPSLNSDLIGTRDYPPSSAAEVASKCQALGEVQRTGGDVAEPVWRASLGLIKFAVEGEELAHEWSKGHSGYDPSETQEKMDGWAGGPPTCALFQSYGMCDGCQYAGKITSPIQLGVKLPEPDRVVTPPAPVEVRAHVAEEPENERDGDGNLILPTLPENLFKSFAYRKGTLYIKTEDEDGTPKVVPVCQEFVVPYSIVRPHGESKQGNKAYLKCYRYTLHNTVEEFTIPMAVAATGGKDLVTAFGEVGIVVEGGPMAMYMKGWINHLKSTTNDSLSIERMGWVGRDFVYGANCFRKNRMEPATLAGQLKSMAPSFEPKGDLETWKDLIHQAYGRAGQEQYQFLLACGFGAPLMQFVGDYRGVIVSAVSYKSGQGKTSAQRAAMSIYGEAAKLETAYGRQTTNALYERLGAMGNLPFMIDEVSNIDSGALADMAYAISQGIQKDRLNKSGEVRAQREPWQTLVMTSGNRSLIAALGSGGMQREPEMRRVFEFNFEAVSDLSKREADRIFNDLRDHYGVAGPVYIDYLVKNYDQVRSFVLATSEKITELLNLKREERFWGAAISVAVAGITLANRLGLVTFNAKGMMSWIKQQLEALRASVNDGVGDEYDVIGKLFTDMNFDLYVTHDRGHGRNTQARVERMPRRELVAGRLIRSENMMYLRQEYVKDWCEKHRADMSRIRALLTEKKVLEVHVGAAMNLAVGIPEAAPIRVRPWIINLSMMAALMPGAMPEMETDGEKVVNIRRAGVS